MTIRASGASGSAVCCVRWMCGRVVVWDVAKRSRMFEWLDPAGQITQVVFGPDSRHIFTGNNDGTIYIVDVEATR